MDSLQQVGQLQHNKLIPFGNAEYDKIQFELYWRNIDHACMTVVPVPAASAMQYKRS